MCLLASPHSQGAMLQRGLRQKGVVMSRHSESFPASHSDTRPAACWKSKSPGSARWPRITPGPPAPEPVTDVVFQRIYQAFLGTRALMGITLRRVSGASALGGAAAGGVDGVSLLAAVCTLHAMAVWSWPQLNSLASGGRMSHRQTLSSTVLLDVLLLLSG